MHQRAVLAGGCFWGMQDLIRKRPGIISTRVGYTGGDIPNATYRNHGTHAEGIEIVFDPTVTSYRNILEFFFQIHDPLCNRCTGAVYQYIDPAESEHAFFHQTGDLRHLADIRADSLRAPAAAAYSLRRLHTIRLVTAGHHHIGAAAGKRHSNGTADSFCSPGHHNGFP